MRPIRQPASSTSIDSTMTPMIDVIFLLQIFFLCTMGMVIPEALLPTDLPKTAGATTTVVPVEKRNDLESIKIRLSGGGAAFAIEMNQRRVAAVADLRRDLQALASIDRATPVVLQIADDVELGDMLSVYDACLAADFANVNFATRKRTAPAP